MEGIRARPLVFAALVVLCLSIAAPVRAVGEGASGDAARLPAEMRRDERLLLLDTVAMFWNMGVRIGEKAPDDAASRGVFGLVEKGRLSPAFVARVALQLMVLLPTEDGAIARVPEADASSGEERERRRLFDGVPERYTLYIPFARLEKTAREWLGWPFDATALPRGNDILPRGRGVFVDAVRLFEAWPPRMPGETFALSSSLYPEGAAWIMEGDARAPAQAPGDIWRIRGREAFRLKVTRTDGHWRILSLDFRDTMPW